MVGESAPNPDWNASTLVGFLLFLPFAAQSGLECKYFGWLFAGHWGRRGRAQADEVTSIGARGIHINASQKKPRLKLRTLEASRGQLVGKSAIATSQIHPFPYHQAKRDRAIAPSLRPARTRPDVL